MQRIFRISLNLFYSIEKSQIVLGQRGFDKIFLGLLVSVNSSFMTGSLWHPAQCA
jgi:hypothetical protein